MNREGADQREICIVIGSASLAVCRTYAQAPVGTLLALVGSDGYVEIAVREGSAAERLGLGVGATLEVRGV